MAIGLTFARLQGRTVAAAAWLFVAGTVLFSGSLYVLTLTGTRWWGAVERRWAASPSWRDGGLLLTARVSSIGER